MVQIRIIVYKQSQILYAWWQDNQKAYYQLSDTELSNPLNKPIHNIIKGLFQGSKNDSFNHFKILSSQEVEGLQKYKYIDVYLYQLSEYMVKKTPYLSHRIWNRFW